MALFQVASADEVVRTMIDHMTNGASQSHLPLKSGPSTVPALFKLHFNACSHFIFECNLLFDAGDSVVVCVNNLGALSSLEMAVVTQAAINSLGNLLFKHH